MNEPQVLLAGIRVVATFAFCEDGTLAPELVNMRKDFPNLAAFLASGEAEIRSTWDKLAADPAYRGEEVEPSA